MKTIFTTIVQIFGGVCALIVVLGLLALGRVLRTGLEESDWYDHDTQ